MSATAPQSDPATPKPPQDLVTLQTHVLQRLRDRSDVNGSLSWLISALSISAKIISSQLRRARLEDILGALGTENVQGERQQKLDVIANDVLMRALGDREGVAVVASEEAAEPVVLTDHLGGERGYCVLFDPLDGSSNIDVCGGVGTIFSIVHQDRRKPRVEASVLQHGAQQVAAGYVLYGSSTVFVLTLGDGVDMFVLDPAIGAFIRVAERLQIPEGTRSYSLNEGHRQGFPQGYRDYLDWAQGNGYSGRYAGAMVADVHRTLLKGGVFVYPPTDKAPRGKLRLLYEANPMAMLVEQAGGLAMAAPGAPIMQVEPTELHQRTPVILGSRGEVERVLSFLG